MAADTETAPALTPETLAELDEVVRRGPAYSFTDAMLACEHLPALIASARRTQQAEAERDAAVGVRDSVLRAHGNECEQLRASIRRLVDERDAALKRAEAAEARVKEWEVWHSDLTYDFCGVTDNSAADRLHDWSWIEDHRPPPPTLSQPGAAS